MKEKGFGNGDAGTISMTIRYALPRVEIKNFSFMCLSYRLSL